MQAHIVKSFDAQIDALKDKVTQMATACERQIEKATQTFLQINLSFLF